MSDTDAPFSMLDETAISAMEVRREPYDYGYVDQAIAPALKEKILADAPAIPHRGTYGVPNLRYGPNFAAVLKDLLNPRFRKIVERKFGIDLSKAHPTIVMMGNTTGHYNEGYSHPDSKHKLFTVLLGFSREWPHQRGQLRVLRSSDREDVAFEYPPEFGKMLMFRVCDHSWHGFLPQKGQRMSLQFCWVDSRAYATKTYVRHYLSAIGKSIPVFSKLLEYMPRNWKKALKGK